MRSILVNLVPLALLLVATAAEARYCNSPSCAMCARIFGPMPGFEPRPLTAIDSTPHSVVAVMVAVLNLSPEDILYDLGCGDARVLIEAVRTTGCRAVGIELDPAVAAIARANVAQSGVGARIRIVEGDATEYKYPLSHATAVFLYLYSPLIAELLPKIKTSRIVSYQHPLPGRSTTVIKTPDGLIYLSLESTFGQW